MATKFAVETIFKAVDNISGPLGKMTKRMGALNRAALKLRAPFDGVARIAKKIATIGAVGGAAAVGAITVALGKAADEADRLAKTSRRLDFDIGALQQWEFIAEQSGVSTELLNKSLGAFSKRLGEAKAGQGPLVSGLKKLNPQLLKQLQQTDSVSDAFELYIKAMRSSESATEQAALANAAFSRSGLSLVNISHNSADAIAAMQKEMTENGMITQESAESAEAYNDAVNSLTRAIRGAIQVAVLPLAKLLTPLIRDVRAWVAVNKDLIRVGLEKFLRKVLAVAKRVFDAFRDGEAAQDVLKGMATLAGKAAEAAVYLGQNWEKVTSVVKWLVIAYASLQAVILATSAATSAAVTASKAITVATWAWNAASVAMNAVLATGRAAMLALNIVMYANPIGLVIAAVVALTAAIAAAIYYWDDITAAASRLWETFLEAGPTTDLIVAAISILTGPLGWLASAALLITKHWEPIKGFFAQLWADVVTIFKSAIDWIMSAVDSVMGAVDSVISAGRAVTDFVGLTDEEPAPAPLSPRSAGAAVAPPMEDVLKTIVATQSSAEVTLRNETNATATVSQQRGPMSLQIANSGAF